MQSATTLNAKLGLRIQRWYAFSLLALRDAIRATSFDSLYEWKVQVFVSMAQTFLVAAALFMTAAVIGYRASIEKRTFIVLWAAVWSVLYFANGKAERALLPRFQSDFLRLGKKAKIVVTIGSILFLVLSAIALFLAAIAARGLPT